MDTRTAYIYRPSSARPMKRQRIEVEDEFSSSLEQRKDDYRKQWTTIEQHIRKATAEANASNLSQLEKFLLAQTSSFNQREKLSVALVPTSHGSGFCADMFQQLSIRQTVRQGAAFASLDSSSCSDLKSLLKSINTTVTSTESLGHDEQVATGTTSTKGPKLLNYDVRLLQRWCSERGTSHVIVAIAESESFDHDTFASFIALLHSWRNRLKFTLLLGVSSSVSMLSDRLPASIQKLVEPQIFPLPSSHDSIDRVFEHCVSVPGNHLYPGPSLCEMLVARQHEHAVDIESFIQSLKYAYMSHFYGNCLSVFLNDHVNGARISAAHYEALRSLPSFRQHIENLVKSGRAETIKYLLDSDDELFKYTRGQLSSNQDKLTWAIATLKATQSLHIDLGMKLPSFTDLYCEAMTTGLKKSPIVREVMVRVRLSPASVLARLLATVQDIILSMPPIDYDLSPDHLGDLIEQLGQLAEHAAGSEVDQIKRHPHESTKKAKKLSPQEKARAELLKDCCESLESYFTQTLFDYRGLVFHEILFYDFKTTHRDAFTPKIRFAVERALSLPQDYLACSCCAGVKEGLSPTQPPTSILYQLYLESGSLLNVFDLWTAFEAVVGKQYDNEQLVKALFYRSLAELKAMGFVKLSRKKADHVAKLAWKGL